MNNMQKAFKNKASCGLADGGRPDPNMLGTGMAARAGLALGGRQRQIDNAVAAATGGVPAPTPAVVAPAGRGGMSGRRDSAVPPAAMLAAQRRGLADGGRLKRKPNGGEVEGPGGPTDDEAGVYALSDDEYVLPADTVEAMGGAEALDEIRDATHEFVDESNRPRGLANGGLGGAYDWMKNKAGSGLQAGRDALSSMRGAPAQPGAPAAPKINPKTSAGGFTNAERVASAAKANPVGTPETAVRGATPRDGFQPRPPRTPGTGRFEKESAARKARAAAYANRPPPVAPAPPVAGGLAKTPSRAVRFAKGVGTKVLAPLAALDAIGDSTAEDSTARYAKRFGVSEPTGDGSAGDMLKFAGLRAGGFASDLGNSLTLGLAGKMYRDKPGEAVAAPATPDVQLAPAQEQAAPATPAQAEDARVSQELLNQGVSVADQGDSRMSYSDAQASSMRQDAGLGAREDYKLGGGGDRSTVPGALDGSVYDNGNADIYATSTRPDGKLNSFTGVGNGNRPNWEQRNPEMHREGLARADKMKSDVVSIAANYAAQGDREGAYRMAAGDPAATAAVEQAFQQRGLRQEALNGNSSAASVLAQQGKDATDVQVANITAGGGLRAAQAKAQTDMMKAQQDQSNWERTHKLAQGAAGREDSKLLRERQERALADAGIRRLDENGDVTPQYQEFATGVQADFLALAGGKGPIPTLDDMSEGDQQIFIRAHKAKKAIEPKTLERIYLKYIKQTPYTPTEGIMRGAPQASTYDEGFLYDTVRDGNNTPLAVPGGLTAEQQEYMRRGQ